MTCPECFKRNGGTGAMVLMSDKRGPFYVCVICGHNKGRLRGKSERKKATKK